MTVSTIQRMIAQELTTRNMNIQHLANFLGCSKQFAHAVLRGRKPLPAHRVRALRAALELDDLDFYELWFADQERRARMD